MKPDHAFIFDLDGTLVDSLCDIAAALNGALTELHQRRASRREMRRWVGDGLTELCRRALPEESIHLLPRLAESAKRRYQERGADETRPYRNVMQMLDLLTNNKTPLAVLSNKPHVLTEQVLEQLGMRHYFLAVRGCASDEERKPYPGVALEIAARVGMAPSRVFFVGDSPVDIQTARNAGMIAVAVSWGFRNRRELRAARPDHLVEDPLEVVQLPGK
jgi:phosphoglycolate phosphatase